MVIIINLCNLAVVEKQDCNYHSSTLIRIEIVILFSKSVSYSSSFRCIVWMIFKIKKKPMTRERQAASFWFYKKHTHQQVISCN